MEFTCSSGHDIGVHVDRVDRIRHGNDIVETEVIGRVFGRDVLVPLRHGDALGNAGVEILDTPVSVINWAKKLKC